MIESPIERLEHEIPVLRRFARALVGNAERADDLVQDSLERALTRLDSYTPGTNMRAWLFTILRNSHINELRRARMTASPPETIEALTPPIAARQDQGLSIRDLERALDKLNPEMRQVLLLIGLEGMSYDEAAAVLDVKLGTVKSRLCRGREALRRLLEGVEYSERRPTARRPAIEPRHATDAIILAFKRIRAARLRDGDPVTGDDMAPAPPRHRKAIG